MEVGTTSCVSLYLRTSKQRGTGSVCALSTPHNTPPTYAATPSWGGTALDKCSNTTGNKGDTQSLKYAGNTRSANQRAGLHSTSATVQWVTMETHSLKHTEK